jgi:hypothetical protein
MINNVKQAVAHFYEISRLRTQPNPCRSRHNPRIILIAQPKPTRATRNFSQLDPTQPDPNRRWTQPSDNSGVHCKPIEIKSNQTIYSKLYIVDIRIKYIFTKNLE